MKTIFISETWYGDDLILDVDESLFLLTDDTQTDSTPSTPTIPNDQAELKDKQQ